MNRAKQPWGTIDIAKLYGLRRVQWGTINMPSRGNDRRPPLTEDDLKKLGEPQNGLPHHCSICGIEIPDDHVPLILWEAPPDPVNKPKEDGRMWCFCEDHEAVPFQLLQVRTDPTAERVRRKLRPDEH